MSLSSPRHCSKTLSKLTWSWAWFCFFYIIDSFLSYHLIHLKLDVWKTIDPAMPLLFHCQSGQWNDNLWKYFQNLFGWWLRLLLVKQSLIPIWKFHANHGFKLGAIFVSNTQPSKIELCPGSAETRCISYHKNYIKHSDLIDWCKWTNGWCIEWLIWSRTKVKHWPYLSNTYIGVEIRLTCALHP